MSKTTSFAGKKDWRVPSLVELQSLLDKNCTDPAIDMTAFPNVPPSSVYWSASLIEGASGGAWTVNFYDSGNYWGYLHDYNSVRLVRDGKIEEAADCSGLDSDHDDVNDCKDKCPASITGSKVNESGCPISLDLKGVQFELDSAVLTANLTRILDGVAKELIAYSGEKKAIEVQGHTSSEASFAHNQKLSQRRAQSFINYLKKQGVKDKLTAKGYGENHPIADNSTKAGREQNRRVELHWLAF